MPLSLVTPSATANPSPVLTERIALVEVELARHLDSLTAKPSITEAKAWAKKYNNLCKQLDDLRASDPNRKVRIKDEDDSDEDSES